MTYISAELRRQVIDRAGGCCEYCLMNTKDRLLPFEIDHIISEKHGGLTDSDNLCLACYRCNGLREVISLLLTRKLVKLHFYFTLGVSVGKRIFD